MGVSALIVTHINMLQTNIKNPWTCKPVYIASKKKVSTAYNPNSYRIFQDGISDKAKGPASLRRADTTIDVKQTSNEPETGYYGGYSEMLKDKPGYINKHPREPSRRNCPHPQSARFLRSNVFQLNDAIPFIATDCTDLDQKSWWGKQELQNTSTKSIRKEKSKKLEKTYSLPTITRAAPPKTSPWILNHMEANKGLKKSVEHISYRHCYNSRTEASEPIRGKLHGSFVWSKK